MNKKLAVRSLGIDFSQFTNCWKCGANPDKVNPILSKTLFVYRCMCGSCKTSVYAFNANKLVYPWNDKWYEAL